MKIMSRILRTILMSAYAALFVQFIKSLQITKNIEIVEIEYFLEKKSPTILGHELLKHQRIVSILNSKFRKLERVPTDYKYVLKWSSAYSHYNSPVFVNGQKPFLQNNCTYTNCFMTNEKTILSDLGHYDAILFDVENNWDFHPVFRSPYQKYVFLASESSANFPICTRYVENYYNWTWTYKLNSDIKWSFITILYKNGTFAGPKTDMEWIQPMMETPDYVRRIIQGKNKTVAWFVSNCGSQNSRQNVTAQIQYALMEYGMTVDIYGWCGPLKCPMDRWEDCLELLQKEYYFYLSFENSLAEDYVTEKLAHAVLHYTVPVVYGGANYSRFLPPGSYIDANVLDAKTVAQKIHEAIKYPELYANYFRWHNYYIYKNRPGEKDVCTLCEKLNEPLTFSAKKDFRNWWNAGSDVCSYGGKRNRAGKN